MLEPDNSGRQVLGMALLGVLRLSYLQWSIATQKLEDTTPKRQTKQPGEELLDKLLSGHESSPTLKALAVEWPEFKKKYNYSYNTYDEEQTRFLRFVHAHSTYTDLLVKHKFGMTWRPYLNGILVDDVKLMPVQGPLPPPDPKGDTPTNSRSRLTR